MIAPMIAMILMFVGGCIASAAVGSLYGDVYGCFSLGIIICFIGFMSLFVRK